MNARGGVLLVMLLLAGCGETRAFRCFANDQCGAAAVCEPEGFCSFADGTCASGRRFGAQSPDTLAEVCVGAPDPEVMILAPLIASADTILDRTMPGSPLGGASAMRIDVEPLQNGLLRFQPTLPAGRKLFRAELRLYVPQDGQLDGGRVQIYAVTEPWDEASATWTQRSPGTPWSAEGAGPASRAASPLAEFTPRNARRDYTVRLPADVVAAWIATPAENHGVVLVVTGTPDQGCTFSTREDGNADWRPRLVLEHKNAN